jgi:hypothetical protein
MTAVMNELGFSTIEKIYHQTRHPLSWMHTQRNRDTYIWPRDAYSKHHYEPLAPLIEKDGILRHHGVVKFLMLWLRANEYIENHMNPIFRFKIEDMHYASPSMIKLCEMFDVEPRENLRGLFTRKHGKSQRPWNAVWESWPEVHEMYADQLEQVKQKALEYGYEA